MADKTYEDKNGATWIIIDGGGGLLNRSFFGTPDPASKRRYDPQPPDTDVVRTQGAAASLIEKYAADHKGDLGLVVTATRDPGVGLLVLLILAVLAFDDGL